MKHISLKNSKKFALISKDKNKIHLNKKIASYFFFREPIVHGINLLINGLVNFCHKKKNYLIEGVKINFNNFCLNNENFSYKIKNQSFQIFSKLNVKLNANIKFKSDNKKKPNIKKLNSLSKKILNFYHIKSSDKSVTFFSFLSHLIFISKKIGNFNQKENCLIHSIISEANESSKTNLEFFKTKKIIKNVFQADIDNYGYRSKVVFSKLIKLKLNLKKFTLDKNTLKKINNKKILIFGATGDVSRALIYFLKKSNAKIYKYSLKKKIKYLTLKNFIVSKKPDFIFYFSSPPIINDKDKNNYILKKYNEVYFDKFKTVLNILQKNKFRSKVFYPSTFALQEKSKYKRIYNYLAAKQNGESLCKSHDYKKYIYCFRLPAYKSKSNYNMLGFYGGEELYKLKKYLKVFFNR